MIVLVSGGFDPLHVGHVRLLLGAAARGRVLVALNSDGWLVRKKGYVFMPWEERKEILEALGCVNLVLPVADEDGTVCDALERWRPHYFANGGDRNMADLKEDEVCRRIGIVQLFGVGGVDKVRSSSELVGRARG